MPFSSEEREEFYKKILKDKDERYHKKFLHPGQIHGNPKPKPESKKRKQEKLIDKAAERKNRRDAERIARYIKGNAEFDNYRQKGFDKDGRYFRDGKIYKEK